jgi:hypothetical protein
MKNIIISLVGEQTIPNFLFIKTIPDDCHHVFITSNRMEDESRGNRRKFLLNALKISEENSSYIIVDQESKSDIFFRLESFEWNKFDKIYLNLTGGTKIMSIACYDYFKDKTKEIWYLPINSSQFEFIEDNSITMKIDYRMNVDEYLTCCGINKDEKRYLEKSVDFSQDEVNNFYQLHLKNDRIHFLTEEVRKLFRSNNAPYKKKYEKNKIVINTSSEFDFLRELFDLISFNVENERVEKKQIEFITGEWFELLCYYYFKSIGVDDIKFGVQLNPKSKEFKTVEYFTHNDLDLVYTKNNTLFVIECKSSGLEQSELLNKTIYLASALRKYFGITVNSLIATLSELKIEDKDKALVFGIKTLDKNDFLSDELSVSTNYKSN